MNKQRGFTLIELIIVIIILGILAVTAAPRFFNFATDARISTLKGVEGSMNGAASLIYGKAVIAGINTIDQDECSDGAPSPTFTAACIVEGVELKFGYPTAEPSGIIVALQLSSDWSVVDAGDDFLDLQTDVIAVYQNSITVGSTWNSTTGCFVKYEPATTSGGTPTVTVVSNEC